MHSVSYVVSHEEHQCDWASWGGTVFFSSGSYKSIRRPMLSITDSYPIGLGLVRPHETPPNRNMPQARLMI